MDEHYFLTAMRYIELNRVRAGLVRRAEHWPYKFYKFRDYELTLFSTYFRVLKRVNS